MVDNENQIDNVLDFHVNQVDAFLKFIKKHFQGFKLEVVKGLHFYSRTLILATNYA